jgi:hypothetical protein
MALLDIAMKSGNTTLLAKTDSILEDAATSENGPDLQELRDMANYCFTNDRPEFLPGLIKAGASVPRSGMMYQDTWAIFAYAIYNGLIGKPAWTAISEIHDAVLQLAEPMIHDEKDGSLATCLKAMVGDPEAFKRSITNYCHHKADLATATQAGLIDYDIQGAEDLFKSIDYHGPPDELKAVNDNIDLCQFDTTKGRWTLTVPGNP